MFSNVTADNIQFPFTSALFFVFCTFHYNLYPFINLSLCPPKTHTNILNYNRSQEKRRGAELGEGQGVIKGAVGEEMITKWNPKQKDKG